MRIDIIIPTMKNIDNVQGQIKEIKNTTVSDFDIIATCKEASASINRNIGLDNALSNIIIMMDDDVTGFYPGWDIDLLRPLHEDVAIVSARLLKQDGSFGYMLCEDANTTDDYSIVENKEVPTACIAFWKDDTRFDEEFIGSGWEDNDFCKSLAQKYPDKRFLVNNWCHLIHTNECKNQHGTFWRHNKAHFNKKWGTNR